MCLGIPGKVIDISNGHPLSRMGTVDFGGIRKEVSLAYVPEVKTEDYVIVHAGFAISIIDETEARRVFEYLKEMGDLAELDTKNLEAQETDEIPG